MKIIFKDLENSISFIEVDGIVISKPNGYNFHSFTYTINNKVNVLIPQNANLTQDDYKSLNETKITYTLISNLFIEEKIPFTGELTYTCLIGNEKYFDFRSKELKKINPYIHEDIK